jgi:hypothetical protein
MCTKIWHMRTTTLSYYFLTHVRTSHKIWFLSEGSLAWGQTFSYYKESFAMISDSLAPSLRMMLLLPLREKIVDRDLTRYKQKYQEIAALERVITWCPDPRSSTWIAQRLVFKPHISNLSYRQSVLVLRPTVDSVTMCYVYLLIIRLQPQLRGEAIG